MERVAIVLDRERPSAAELKSCFAQLFASLDERARSVYLKIDAENDEGRRVAIDMEGGELLFHVEGSKSVSAPLRGRYLAEHEIPLSLPQKGSLALVLRPTSGNRMKARRPKFIERIFK